MFKSWLKSVLPPPVLAWWRWIKESLLLVLPPRAAIKYEFRWCHKRSPHLDPPLTFNEKVVYRKVYCHDPRMARLADKVAAKEYVAETLGAEWVIPNFWSGEQLPPRNQRNWPMPYVLKASHGCGWNIFVFSPEDQNWDLIEKTTSQWLRTVYGRRSLEWCYSQMRPRLLVEPFLGVEKVAPIDYKFWVFGGKTAFIQVDLGVLQFHEQYFYDINWNRQHFEYVCPGGKEEVPRPHNLAQLIQGVERLGAPFPFVRVDLYNVNGQPMFGELTFYPNAGRIGFKPESMDAELGRLWAGSDQCVSVTK